MACIDPERGWRVVQERLDRTSNPRHRAMLETLRDHLLAEATADFELLLSTLAPDPHYHFWVEGSGFGGGPRGLDGVTAHYRQLYAENRNVVEYAIERIIVDDEAIVTEGDFHQIFPGKVLLSRGASVDDASAAYLLTMRLALVWPYDADAKLIGEDSYAGGAMFDPQRIRKLERDEIPAMYFRSAS